MKQILISTWVLFSLFSRAQLVRVEASIHAEDLPEGMAKGMIFQLSDSTLVKGGFVESGKLSVQFPSSRGTMYYLKIVAPGFNDHYTDFTVEDTLVNLREIALVKDLMFDEVTVVYEKPQFERTMNGISVNVQGTTLEQLNTLFDVLKASPRLASSDDESIEIIGRGVPLILVDRQPIIANDELKAIPASEVERFEIMTSPSAKYRAQGSGNGVIEVYTSDFHLEGYRGRLRVSSGASTQLQPRLEVNGGLNLKKKKFALDGFFSTNYWQQNNFGESVSESDDGAVSTRSEFDGDRHNRWQNYRLKMRYDVAENQYLSLGIGGHGSVGRNTTNSLEEYYSGSTLVTTESGKTMNDYTRMNFRSYTNYTWDIDTLGSYLEINANYTRRNSVSDNQFESVFGDVDSDEDVYYLSLATAVDRPNIGEIRVNYEQHLDTALKLEFGADFSMLFNQKRFNRFNWQESWINDDLYTNSYDYQEQTGGAYAQISRMWNKIGAQLGIRGEYTRLYGTSATLNQTFMDSSYILPFPNAGVLYEANDNLAITAYYESGIDRPSFTNYDPFIRILDSLSIQYGNPYLRPSYDHTLGLEFDLFYSYNISLTYSRYNDVTSILTFIDTSTFITTRTPWNADYNDKFSLSLSIPIRLKWLDGWNSCWLNYKNYVFTDAFDREPYANLSFGFHSYLSFHLPWKLDLMSRLFVNRWANDVTRSAARASWSLRLTRKFDNPDLSAFVEVNDIFPAKYQYDAVNGNYRNWSWSQNDFTAFRFGLGWKFGRLKGNTDIKESQSGQSGRM